MTEAMDLSTWSCVTAQSYHGADIRHAPSVHVVHCTLAVRFPSLHRPGTVSR
uniref:Uncharacterized protein n=1 Tax=Physcomitrium patens TaxID=3218 RepID=A0A2K1K6I4_PHYPA|nr:hypothetical protein PHYPA_011283 [Physcomitrium patens]